MDEAYIQAHALLNMVPNMTLNMANPMIGNETIRLVSWILLEIAVSYWEKTDKQHEFIERNPEIRHRAISSIHVRFPRPDRQLANTGLFR
uniref:Uncharacterized protein n=1 Tax=Candidatus Kentrum sp. LFY TaxID=2126342 RepID=A0A450ULX6_9GAMM|nr:MAG: hypothetical protein BECKLFY1418A_GA0070994_103228 [Candidatus Kentron sp. LFY]